GDGAERGRQPPRDAVALQPDQGSEGRDRRKLVRGLGARADPAHGPRVPGDAEDSSADPARRAGRLRAENHRLIPVAPTARVRPAPSSRATGEAIQESQATYPAAPDVRPACPPRL